MKKVHSLREWYSLHDAAKRLSITLGEDVESSDILQLAIEKHIKLSLNARHLTAIPVIHYMRILNWDKEVIERSNGGQLMPRERPVQQEMDL